MCKVTGGYLGTIYPKGQVYELLDAASMMELVSVEELCEQIYLESVGRGTCVTTWMLADRYSLTDLKKVCYAMGLEFFSYIGSDEQINFMPEVLLRQLMADDDLYVYSEEVVYNALVKWVRHDEYNRSAKFAELMELVRVHDLRKEVGFVPMMFGHKNAEITKNRFSITQFSHLLRKQIVVAHSSGYRWNHSVVQVCDYMYILGGEDNQANQVNCVSFYYSTYSRLFPGRKF